MSEQWTDTMFRDEGAKCPTCGAERPHEMHLDWCTYEGPEPDDEDES